MNQYKKDPLLLYDKGRKEPFSAVPPSLASNRCSLCVSVSWKNGQVISPTCSWGRFNRARSRNLSAFGFHSLLPANVFTIPNLRNHLFFYIIIKNGTIVKCFQRAHRIALFLERSSGNLIAVRMIENCLLWASFFQESFSLIIL